jgi:tetratricopeptide (TPR) repeat protein
MGKKNRRKEAAKTKTASVPLLPPFTLAQHEELRRCHRLLILVAVVYCLSFSSVSVGDTDDQLMITSSFTFTEMGKFLAPSRFATKDFGGFLFGIGTASGEVYSKYPFGYSLVLVPFIALAGLAGRAFGSTAADVVLCFPSILALLGIAVLIWRSSLRLGFGAATARLLILAFALGSYAWGYAGANYHEPYQALCAAAGFYCLLAALQEPRYWLKYALLGGCALGYGILLRPYFGILAPPLVLGALVGWRKQCSFREAFFRATAYGAPALLASVYTLIANQVLFGNAANFGYAKEFFSTPLLVGLYGLTIGVRKGILWFFPLSVLAPWSAYRLARTGRGWAVAVLSAAVAAQILLISKWWGFESGRAWGDRLILAVLPFVVLLAGAVAQSSRTWKLSLALVVLGVGLNLPGVLIDRLASNLIRDHSNLPDVHFDPFIGQMPTHLWLSAIELTGPFLGSQEANPLWQRPPWIRRYPQSVPQPYRNTAYPILSPWPLRLWLPADTWTRKENGYMRGLLEIAIMRFEKRDARRAMELIDRGLAMDENSAEFLATKGMVYLSSGANDLALGLFDRSVTADPNYDLGLYGRGIILEAKRDYAAARDAYSRILAAPPGMLSRDEVKQRLEKLPK